MACQALTLDSQRQPCYHASSNTAATIKPQQGKPQAKKRLDSQRQPCYHASSNAAIMLRRYTRQAKMEIEKISFPKVKDFMRHHNLMPKLQFNVVYSGWDSDNTGWVSYDREGNKKYVMTCCGVPYFEEESNVRNLIQDYLSWIKETEEALNFKM